IHQVISAKDKENSGITVELIDEKLTKLRGTIRGPPDSPYEASLTLRTVLLSVQSLLALPEPKDPQDAVVAKQKMNEPQLFEMTARFWTSHYAKGRRGKDDELVKKIEKLREMGVTEDHSISTLSCCGWNLDRAIAYIFS
ncbi:hypothetical protein PMAYCL1PPCAC_11726, partial [Pristionchus mayeri]